MKIWKKIKDWGECFFQKSLAWQILIVTLVLLGVILLNLQFFAKGGDAVHKWRIIRGLIEHGSMMIPHPDHHSLRWFLILPTWGICRIAGTSVYAYYIFPVLNYCLGGVLFFLLCRKIFPSCYSVWCVALYAFHPAVISEGTQFMPVVPAMVWIFLALLFIIYAFENKRFFYWCILGSGFSFVLAYGCKESSFFWCVGIFIFLAFQPDFGKTLFRVGPCRINSGMLLLALICLAGLVVETLTLNAIYGSSYGRVELIRGTHFVGMSDPGKTVNWLEYMFSPLRLLHMQGKYYSTLTKNSGLIMAGIGCIYVLVGNFSRNAKIIASATLGAFFMHSYGVIKFDPISYPERALMRYFIPVLVLGTAVYVVAIPEMWERIRKYPAAVALFMILNITLLVNVVIYDLNMRLKDGTVFQVEHCRKTLKYAFANGDAIGIVALKKLEKADEKEHFLPDKHAKMLLSMYWSLPKFFEFCQKGGYITPYDGKRVILWVIPPSDKKDCVIIKRFSCKKFSCSELPFMKKEKI